MQCGSVAGSIVLGLLLTGPGTAADAQSYPVKPMRMIIPAGPGGGVDTVARLVGTGLATAMEQPVVMENRPGAGTTLASEATAKAPPDGYTMLMMTNSHAINASLHRTLRYDPVADFALASLVASVPYWIVVHPSVPARTVKELIALARKRPGELHFASAGAGSGTHLAGELFISMANVTMVHVPYKSGTPALIDVVGGHVQLMVSNTINSRPHVLAKRLVALGISTLKRSPLYPDVPTVAESGLPGYQADVWYGVALPGRTPRDIVGRVNREVVGLLKSAEMREKFAAQGAEIMAGTPEEFLALLRKDIEKWAKVTARLPLQKD